MNRLRYGLSAAVVLIALPLFVLASSTAESPAAASSTGGGGGGNPDDGSSGSDLSDLIRLIVLIVIMVVCAIVSVLLLRSTWKTLRTKEAHNTPAPVPSSPTNKQLEQLGSRIGVDELQIGARQQGGHGHVYAAKWRSSPVAVKEMIHTASEEQLQEELKGLIAMRHPNLCLFQGVCIPAAGKVWIVNEWMERGTLFSVLHDRSLQLDWNRRMAMALDAARAVNYLHRCKPPIVHKHLSSLNVLVSKDLTARVSDYGLDNLRNATKKAFHTQPLWTAPEVLKKPTETSKASDVYSFGVVLWEMTTRAIPSFAPGVGPGMATLKGNGMLNTNAAAGQVNNQVKLVQDIIKGNRPKIPPKTPPVLADLITRCWSANKADRPSFDTIVATLQELMAQSADVNDFTHVDVKVDAAGNAAGGAGRTDEKGATGPPDFRKVASADRPSWFVTKEEIKLETLIGQGSFGEVWLGNFRGKKVAVKKMANVNLALHFRDFVNELNIMCAMRHPNTVLFMGACLEEGSMCILMEYCEKGNLHEILSDKTEGKHIDYHLIMKILIEIAQGMRYLHLNQPHPILHRDLKSLNILVDADYNVKVSDFGLTAVKSMVDQKEDSVDVLRMGTPYWLAPEAMEAGKFTEASDVYSFAMIVWEMFTRETPFQDLGPHRAAWEVVHNNGRPPLPEFIPPRCKQLIRDCWIRDPAQRPSFAKIVEALEVLKSEGLPRIELTAQNAGIYRKKALVYAFKSKDTVIVFKPWGRGESKKGDWVIVGPNDDCYTCDALVFTQTYAKVVGRPHQYRKTGRIFAREMKHDFLMETLEGMEHGTGGDYLAQNPDGKREQWPIAAKTFLSMYELCPIQALSDNSEEPVRNNDRLRAGMGGDGDATPNDNLSPRSSIVGPPGESPRSPAAQSLGTAYPASASTAFGGARTFGIDTKTPVMSASMSPAMTRAPSSAGPTSVPTSASSRPPTGNTLAAPAAANTNRSGSSAGTTVPGTAVPVSRPAPAAGSQPASRPATNLNTARPIASGPPTPPTRATVATAATASPAAAPNKLAISATPGLNGPPRTTPLTPRTASAPATNAPASTAPPPRPSLTLSISGPDGSAPAATGAPPAGSVPPASPTALAAIAAARRQSALMQQAIAASPAGAGTPPGAKRSTLTTAPAAASTSTTTASPAILRGSATTTTTTATSGGVRSKPASPYKNPAIANALAASSAAFAAEAAAANSHSAVSDSKSPAARESRVLPNMNAGVWSDKHRPGAGGPAGAKGVDRTASAAVNTGGMMSDAPSEKDDEWRARENAESFLNGSGHTRSSLMGPVPGQAIQLGANNGVATGGGAGFAAVLPSTNASVVADGDSTPTHQQKRPSRIDIANVYE